ncbi:MAG: amino acid ABC transporter permease [Firmicutes bacterium]|nr:amino acid ABC transporter permease [Bacillota bacterium]
MNLLNINFNLEYFLSRFSVIGKFLPVTLGIAIFSMLIGLLIALVIAFLLDLKITGLNKILRTYISFFRGTPLMVQLFIFYFGFPQVFPRLAQIPIYIVAVYVMSINGSAYMSETIRASINSVDKIQLESALSIGMTKYQAMKRIILPQAARIAIPPLGNTFISLVQGTAITFLLGVKEIMAVAKISASSTYKFLENYLVVGIIYWIITLVFTNLLNRLETKMNKAY